MFPAIFDDADLFWPDEDWRAFLAVALKSGVRVIYLERSDVGASVRDQASSLPGRLDEDTLTELE